MRSVVANHGPGSIPRPEKNSEDKTGRNKLPEKSNGGRTVAAAAIAQRAAHGRTLAATCAALPHQADALQLPTVCYISARWPDSTRQCVLASARPCAHAATRDGAAARDGAGSRRPPSFFFCFDFKNRDYAIQAQYLLKDPSLCSDTTVGDNGGSGSRFPGAAVDRLIRSTTGNAIPPSVCTRRSDGFLHELILLITLIETSSITKTPAVGGGVAAAAAAALGGGRRRREVWERRGG
ncbi:hypothetical protein F511_09352 [Dorcoceras hygrometricum]|uniref:Uncharacterized protein n=1 Tax=Dorcoceras hygrometricum TaxID=472368 RepID=A0A2Z7C0X3_9LAMI|nr:hypothetical protein F511_09352 [Dorcoceras hygrometricum]